MKGRNEMEKEKERRKLVIIGRKNEERKKEDKIEIGGREGWVGKTERRKYSR